MRDFKLGQLTKNLIAVTCLTVASASATTIAESSVGGFGATFGAATLLPVGTDQITGIVCTACADQNDWFAVPGLDPGATVEITEAVTAGPLNFFVLDAQQSILQSNLGVNNTGSAVSSFTIPLDGKLVFEVQQSQGSVNAPYAVSLFVTNSPGVPEPGTLALCALSLAFCAGLRRRLAARN